MLLSGRGSSQYMQEGSEHPKSAILCQSHPTWGKAVPQAQQSQHKAGYDQPDSIWCFPAWPHWLDRVPVRTFPSMASGAARAMQQKPFRQAIKHPLGTGRGQGPRPCGPLLRVILLIAVWGSCKGTAPWGSSCCQQTKPHRERRGCHHACLLSPSPDGTQCLAQGQERS